jgi:hypothetical protein
LPWCRGESRGTLPVGYVLAGHVRGGVAGGGHGRGLGGFGCDGIKYGRYVP